MRTLKLALLAIVVFWGCDGVQLELGVREPDDDSVAGSGSGHGGTPTLGGAPSVGGDAGSGGEVAGAPATAGAGAEGGVAGVAGTSSASGGAGEAGTSSASGGAGAGGTSSIGGSAGQGGAGGERWCGEDGGAGGGLGPYTGELTSCVCDGPWASCDVSLDDFCYLGLPCPITLAAALEVLPECGSENHRVSSCSDGTRRIGYTRELRLSFDGESGTLVGAFGRAMIPEAQQQGSCEEGVGTHWAYVAVGRDTDFDPAICTIEENP
jgi:hypothetical protein